jgi:SAM-dependent MidA family methyltransferase
MSVFGTYSNNDSDSTELPVPDNDAIEHSQKVCARIQKEITKQQGSINFNRFMELALYEPGLGYYAAGSTKLGESGDFITAPESSSVYSYCLARQCQQVLSVIDEGKILELGPGTGKMACDILQELERLDCLPEKYLLLETSADLRERQQEQVKKNVPHLEDIIHWLDTLPTKKFNGIIIANEVLDAMPVHRIVVHGDFCKELHIGVEENKFVWIQKLLDEQLKLEIERELKTLTEKLPQGYTSEINTNIQAWISSLTDFFQQGIMLFVDYGYPRQEYYHPQRISGTLLCHYRHRMHPDPFFYPGLQDISSSVNFTRVAEAAVDAGLEVRGYTTQAHFLMSCGLEDIAKQQESISQIDSVKLSNQIRMLTMPGEMGERYKVIALTKNMDIPLLGFQFIDLRAKL